MDEKKQKEMLNEIVKSKAKILVSGYDCELYDILTNNGFIKINFDVKTVDGNRNKKLKIETLWKNY
jgi:hypothetical protein